MFKMTDRIVPGLVFKTTAFFLGMGTFLSFLSPSKFYAFCVFLGGR